MPLNSPTRRIVRPLYFPHRILRLGGLEMWRAVLAVLGLAAGSCIAVVGAPEAVACPSGTYEAASGDCVPSPAYGPSAPAGATARCGDGTYSFSQSRSGTCSHHGGVAQWLSPSPRPSIPLPFVPPTAPTGGDDYVALAISPLTSIVGWGTAESQLRADAIAISECAKASGDVCQLAAEMHNGCVAIAVNPTMFHGGYGPTTAEAIMSAGAGLPGGRIIAVQCSK